MLDTFRIALSTCLIGLAAWLAIMFIWIDFIEWRLVPQSEIDATALKLVADHGADAGSIALAGLSRAEDNSDPGEIGRCKRVCKAVQTLMDRPVG